MEAVQKISQFFQPHSTCVLNDPLVIFLHVLGDAVTALSYFLIPCAIVWTSWRYRGTHSEELRNLLLHGAAFIVACGGTHLMDIWTWWNPDYIVAGCVKVFCGLVSGTFVWRMWRYLVNHPLRMGYLS
jgi:hypothetical protein